MIVTIDPALPAPAFEQLRTQVTRLVRSGALAEGTRLPTVRQLAKDLDLAPGTVQRAYRELERDGLVVGRGRRGTFVHDEVPAVEPDLLDDALAGAARRFALAVQQLGAPTTDALAAVRAALDAPPGAHPDPSSPGGGSGPDDPSTASLVVDAPT